METKALARTIPVQGPRGDAEMVPDVGGEVAVVGEAHGPGELRRTPSGRSS
jgi:hypothetical protein